MSKEFICNPKENIVETKAGKLRGFKFDGIYTFRGIKYADAKRFQMPAMVSVWEGVRDALVYGPVCPVPREDSVRGTLLIPQRFWVKDEHCQFLNIWTPTLEGKKKKPVMVWLHGGGHSFGSSIEQNAYDGHNLAAFGDVVVVSLNHRINILGYLDLSSFGKKYANSGNAGTADIVAALQWIHENIAAFGGDPDNVTLFGQSGGGAKILELLSTPSADGLFHKGIIHSGIIDIPDVAGESGGREIVQALLYELGLGEADVEKLENMSYEYLIQAYLKAGIKVLKKKGYTGCEPLPNDYYLGNPLKVGFTEHAKEIPLMVGSVYAEGMAGIKNKDELREEDIYLLLEKKFGEDTREVVRMFKKAYPKRHLSDLLFLDTMFRVPSIEFVEKRVKHGGKPVYMFLFSPDFSYDGGTAAWHCSDIPFIFHNVDKVEVCNMSGADKLEKMMCGAWTSFAYTGDPSKAGLKDWKSCTRGNVATMIFENQGTRLVDNFDNKLLRLLQKCAGRRTQENSGAEIWENMLFR